MRRMIGLMAVVLAATFGLVGVAAPANAAPYKSKLCWMYYEDGMLKVHCQDIQVEFPWEKYLECWMCGFGVDWSHDPVIREEFEGLVGEQAVKGLTKLGEAEFTRDRALQARLRGEALEAFTAAARYSGESRVGVSAMGEMDPEKLSFDPRPDPWLQAAGADMAQGLTLLQQAAQDPANAARFRSQAMVQFDEAYTELSEQRVIVG